MPYHQRRRAPGLDLAAIGAEQLVGPATGAVSEPLKIGVGQPDHVDVDVAPTQCDNKHFKPKCPGGKSHITSVGDRQPILEQVGGRDAIVWSPSLDSARESEIDSWRRCHALG